MHAFEEEFRQRLDAIGRDARACIVHTFFGLAFNWVVARDRNLRERINDHGHFWTGVLSAQQAAAFIALGRLYDTDRRARNAVQLLNYARNHRGIFSRDALAVRKVAQGLSEADANVYVADAYELQPGGLDTIVNELGIQKGVYDHAALDIRNQVFAHATALTPEQREELFAHLPIREFGHLALIPYLVHEWLWQLFYNGRRPVIEPVPSHIDDVMAATPPANTSTWLHLHVAADTAAFLRALG